MHVHVAVGVGQYVLQGLCGEEVLPVPGKRSPRLHTGQSSQISESLHGPYQALGRKNHW